MRRFRRDQTRHPRVLSLGLPVCARRSRSGVFVANPVRVAVGEATGLLVAVGFFPCTRVAVGSGVFVASLVGVAVGEEVGLLVAVGVEVPVRVGLLVAVGVEVPVGVGLLVAVGVNVAAGAARKATKAM